MYAATATNKVAADTFIHI